MFRHPTFADMVPNGDPPVDGWGAPNLRPRPIVFDPHNYECPKCCQTVAVLRTAEHTTQFCAGTATNDRSMSVSVRYVGQQSRLTKSNAEMAA